jgi:hypothetical protein
MTREMATTSESTRLKTTVTVDSMMTATMTTATASVQSFDIRPTTWTLFPRRRESCALSELVRDVVALTLSRGSRVRSILHNVTASQSGR